MLGLMASQDATGSHQPVPGLGIAIAVAASVAGGIIVNRARSKASGRKEAPSMFKTGRMDDLGSINAG
jgi:hypothetical protein